MIGGGGTGGHIFPALAIAQEIGRQVPEAEILFVGAKGRMEMTKVPEAGYQIVGLPIAGLQRKLSLNNLSLPLKVFSSLQQAMGLVREFKPTVIIGVGGYASFPLLLAAMVLNVPYLIQEQNSFAGLTNKLLSKRAKSICVAFSEMDRFFPSKKIKLTGNPVRTDLVQNHISQYDGLQHFGLQPGKPTLLAMGGSLGARTINKAVAASLSAWKNAGFQLIWQTGNAYAETAKNLLSAEYNTGFITMPFIKDMAQAYAAADLVVSRAGALSVAEICICGKASILVPSPNVAEDHQTKNALSLVNEEAALMIPDGKAEKELPQMVSDLLRHPDSLEVLAMNAHKMARPDATQQIVKQVFQIAAA
jgi:UDP-N-acetylglucosamine--N-acetylmuramyl-(pentapeptide) pyrophosphoryl-undecaprenol N-acetylglucosamine transferase